MQWQDVIEDITLQNLPYKIELNEKGNIEMSPASNKHGILQTEISFILKTILAGHPITECSILTSKNVKVADVAWCSNNFLKAYGFETPYPKAPEICVEIVSPSNTEPELEDKRQLYFEAGAKEVWIVFDNGQIDFYDAKEKMKQSNYPIDVTEIKLPSF